MLYVRRNNGSDWLTNWFNDGFLDGKLMRPAVATAPAVNVKEDVKAYTMEIASPGLKKEYVRVHVDEENVLHIALENKMEHKGEDKHEHYLRREFSYTNFQQTYTVPDDVIKENISAAVNDGVLAITLPKMSKEHVEKIQRHIEIK